MRLSLASLGGVDSWVQIQSFSTSSQEARVDREGLIELLNADLQTEYRSIVQYVQHTAVVKGRRFG
jgi:hypothetical protein